MSDAARTTAPPASRLTTVACAIGAGFFLVTGAWSFFAPKSFYDTVAPWPPYNAHFLRDGGSFELGLGIALLIMLFTRRGAVAALAGAAAGAVAHAFSHVIDYGDGGRSTDPYGLGLFAVILAAATVHEWKRAQ